MPDNTKDALASTVSKLISEKAKVSVSDHHVDICHRIGSAKPGHSRPLVVRIIACRDAELVLKQYRKLNPRQTDLKAPQTRTRCGYLHNIRGKFRLKAAFV